MIHKINTILTFNKLAYVRICIIELSRIPLHEFYYGYIKIKYGNKLRLLFKDTGSLVYEIKTKIFMKILVRIKMCLLSVIILVNQNIKMIQTD